MGVFLTAGVCVCVCVCVCVSRLCRRGMCVMADGECRAGAEGLIHMWTNRFTGL